MAPYDSGSGGSSGSSTSGSSSSASTVTKPHPQEMDGLLAGAGYKVRSSELHHVAQRLERLETAMVNSSSEISQLIASDAVHYNPSDIATWVDSILSEFNNTAPSLPSDLPIPIPVPPDFPPHLMSLSNSLTNHPHSAENQNVAWTDPSVTHQPQPQPQPQQGLPQQHLTVVTSMEEDSSIKLVHMLVTCADSVHRGDLSFACSLIVEMQGLLSGINTDSGIGKVAGYFIDALSRRVFTPNDINSVGPGAGAGAGAGGGSGTAYENEVLYHHYYEASPYLKFAHFTANQAILEAFEGHDCVHVIDFNLMHGLQWPALIQALALRSGGPPLLRLTGIGPPSPDGRDSLREIGLRLAELARSVNVRFAFRGVAASRLEDVKPWMLQVSPKETVAVNSVMQLHRLLGSNSNNRTAAVEMVLGWIRNLNPKIMTVVEQEADHNQTGFLERFTEALFYYSTMFDSLEACSFQPEKTLAEMYLQKEICNVVSCEGSARVERHEPLAKWRSRLRQAGFKPLHLGSNAFKQASMLLTLFSAEGFCVEENEGCLTLGWHSRPLIAASAWQAAPDADHSFGIV